MIDPDSRLTLVFAVRRVESAVSRHSYTVATTAAQYAYEVEQLVSYLQGFVLGGAYNPWPMRGCDNNGKSRENSCWPNDEDRQTVYDRFLENFERIQPPTPRKNDT